MKYITCEQIREELSDYLDQSLSSHEMEDFRQHLASCDACRKETEELAQLLDLLRGIPEVPVPESFKLNFKRAMREESELQIKQTMQKNARKKPLWKSMSAVAAVLAIGVLSFAMMQDGLHIGMQDLAMNQSRLVDEGAGAVGYSDSPLQEGSPMETSLDQNVFAGEDAKEYTKEDTKEDISVGTIPTEAPSAPPQQLANAEAHSEGLPSVASDAVENGLPEAQEGSADAATNNKEAADSPTSSGLRMSRGAGYFATEAEYERACTEWMTQYVTAVNAKDDVLFSDSIAKGGINGYTTDTVEAVLELYGEYLGSDEVTYKRLHCEKKTVGNMYVVEGTENSLRLLIKATASGLSVREVLLDHGPWLSEQLKDTDFTLENYEVQDHGRQVTFQVKCEQIEDDCNSEPEETKEIIWKKTE